MPSYYDILGIAKSSNDKQIKRAFYKISKKYHPDAYKYSQSHDVSVQKANSIFHQASMAYEVLGNRDLRKAYDEKLAKISPIKHYSNQFKSKRPEKTSPFKENLYNSATFEENLKRHTDKSTYNHDLDASKSHVFTQQFRHSRHYKWPWSPTPKQIRRDIEDYEKRKIEENIKSLFFLSKLAFPAFTLSIYILYQYL